MSVYLGHWHGRYVPAVVATQQLQSPFDLARLGVANTRGRMGLRWQQLLLPAPQPGGSKPRTMDSRYYYVDPEGVFGLEAPLGFVEGYVNRLLRGLLLLQQRVRLGCWPARSPQLLCCGHVYGLLGHGHWCLLGTPLRTPLLPVQWACL